MTTSWAFYLLLNPEGYTIFWDAAADVPVCL